jgi:hypothetical protein
MKALSEAESQLKAKDLALTAASLLRDEEEEIALFGVRCVCSPRREGHRRARDGGPVKRQDYPGIDRGGIHSGRLCPDNISGATGTLAPNEEWL